MTNAKLTLKTSVESSSTRIIPVEKPRKSVEIAKNGDGSMSVRFGNGQIGTLAASDADLQAFVIWTMLNPECSAQ